MSCVTFPIDAMLVEDRILVPPKDFRDQANAANEIAFIARSEAIHIITKLPKTRSGRIMRRLMRNVAEGRGLGDTTTLADPIGVVRLRARKKGRRRMAVIL
jgi:acetyl-CoA synthetase